MIYHITPLEEWNKQQSSAHFTPRDFNREGFIHCCSEDQIDGVLERYFRGKTGLLLLTIDDSKLTVPVLYEEGPNQDKFPHIYGLLPKEVIARISKIR